VPASAILQQLTASKGLGKSLYDALGEGKYVNVLDLYNIVYGQSESALLGGASSARHQLSIGANGAIELASRRRARLKNCWKRLESSPAATNSMAPFAPMDSL
jgi:hypothetical protein